MHFPGVHVLAYWLLDGGGANFAQVMDLSPVSPCSHQSKAIAVPIAVLHANVKGTHVFLT